MISAETNERLTRAGPGTPCGELLRRYWQPLCPAAEITAEAPKKRITIMGEDLVVFRDGVGRPGCVEEFCKHRGVSLFYGYTEDDGIRCCYHGWKYDRDGNCVEMPFEPEGGGEFRDSIRLKSYPVRELGGLLFVYMGPDPARAPPLPRWDVLVRDDGARHIRMLPIHRCNWLQVQENTADSTHTYWLHGIMDQKVGADYVFAPYFRRPIERFDFSVCEWGIDRVIVYGGDVPEVETRPPLIFPNILHVPIGKVEVMHWRVPIDDVNTRIVYISFDPAAESASRTPEGAEVPYVYEPDTVTPDGDYDLSTFIGQDKMALETQGAIFDRTRENLGTTDRGIVLFRQMLEEQIARVERGEPPTVAVVPDAERDLMITFESATNPIEGTRKIRAAQRGAGAAK